MKPIRSRLTYANVVSTIALFLVLGGATAFAAAQLGKNSVGAKQLKANAVTATKIKAGAVGAEELAPGSVGANEIAAGAIGTKQLAAGVIPAAAAPSAPAAPAPPATVVAAKIRGTSTAPFTKSTIYPLSNAKFTQATGEDDQLIGAIEVNFPASCAKPRAAQAVLQIDAADPLLPDFDDVAGIAQVEDQASGVAVTRTLQFGVANTSDASTLFAPKAPTAHTVSIRLFKATCNGVEAGSGITVVGAGVDVIGTR